MSSSELAKAISALQAAASRGFEWKNVKDVLEKLQEEVDEAAEAIESGNRVHIEEEVADVLFAAANLARFLKIDGDEALAAATAKFERRFVKMQVILAQQGKVVEDCDLPELVEAWKQMKSSE